MRTVAMRKQPPRSTGLPGRLPDGTRYVIEGRRGKNGRLQIVSRQVILPSGEQFDVTGPAVAEPKKPSSKPASKSASKKPAAAARRKAPRRRG